MSIQMMVFDMAGTTVDDSDNAVARCVAEAVRAAGADVADSEVNPLMGMSKPFAVARLLESRGIAPQADLVDRVHSDFQRRIIDHYRNSPTVRPMPGAQEMFRGLRDRGVRITLDTGFDRTTADVILARLGWDSSIIDDSITTDEVSRGRPDPEMIRVLMERAQINDPARVAKVGDSVSDIEQGINAQCGLVIAVLSDRTRPVVDHYSVIAIEHLREILPILDTMLIAGGAR